MLYVCVYQPVRKGVFLVTRLHVIFFPCMMLRTTDLHRSELHVVHRSPPLSLQADNKCRKALSLSLASVAHLQTRLTGLFAWGNIAASFHPKPLCQEIRGLLISIHLPASVLRPSGVRNKDYLMTLCQEPCNSCSRVLTPEALPRWQVLTPLTTHLSEHCLPLCWVQRSCPKS